MPNFASADSTKIMKRVYLCPVQKGISLDDCKKIPVHHKFEKMLHILMHLGKKNHQNGFMFLKLEAVIKLNMLT